VVNDLGLGDRAYNSNSVRHCCAAAQDLELTAEQSKDAASTAVSPQRYYGPQGASNKARQGCCGEGATGGREAESKGAV